MTHLSVCFGERERMIKCRKVKVNVSVAEERVISLLSIWQTGNYRYRVYCLNVQTVLNRTSWCTELFESEMWIRCLLDGHFVT